MANPFMTAGTSVVATKSTTLPEFREFDWDFDKKTFLYDEYGNHIIKTQNDGLKVWIKKALLVQRYRYRAYFDDYGCELEDKFIGKVPNDEISDSDDIKTFTALKSEKMSLPIVDTAVSDTGEKITLTFNCSNSSLDTGFINREIGIFAKLDDGNEVLYSYSNAGMAYDYIPSKETPTNENTFEVEVYISSEAEINVTIDGSIVYLTKAQVEEKINNHDKTTTAHAQAFAAHNDDETAHSKLFGLCEKIANLGDDIIKKMALTTAITAISALTTDSWFGQLLKMVLTASGVRYLAEQNGYICLGSFFGNIIIQWVYALASDRNVGHDFTLPVACTVYAYTITHQGSSPGATGIDNNKAYDVGWTNTPVWIIAIGHA